MHHTFMHAHTPTHNLWFWPKCPPFAFSVAEISAVAEISGPKHPRPKYPWPKCPTFLYTGIYHLLLYNIHRNLSVSMKNSIFKSTVSIHMHI